MMGVAAYGPTLREHLVTAPVLGALESLSTMFLVVGTAMFFTGAANTWFRTPNLRVDEMAKLEVTK
jgi:hypothetical protein